MTEETTAFPPKTERLKDEWGNTQIGHPKRFSGDAQRCESVDFTILHFQT